MPFTTDVPLLDRWGTPLLFGPGSILVAHTDEEFVTLDELHASVDGFERLAKGCLAAGPSRTSCPASAGRQVNDDTVFSDARQSPEVVQESRNSQGTLGGVLQDGFRRKPSITWPESVDEALCVGWIRKTIDEESYNPLYAAKENEHVERGQHQACKGARRREADAARGVESVRGEAREPIWHLLVQQRSAEFDEPYVSIIKKDKAAWTFFQAQPPSYRKTLIWYMRQRQAGRDAAQAVEDANGELPRGRRLS